jgi:hypothetical protein
MLVVWVAVLTCAAQGVVTRVCFDHVTVCGTGAPCFCLSAALMLSTADPVDQSQAIQHYLLLQH